MSEYLLDTNVLSELMRNPVGPASRRYRMMQDACAISIFVAAEIEHGLLRRPGLRIAARAQELLASLPILPFEEPGQLAYARLRDGLERSGTSIGANDLWIAAHALALDCTLVTANEREFRRVPGLRVENWLA